MRCSLVTSSALSLITNASPTVELSRRYIATEAHYLSLADRIAGAARERRLVLVTGDPPADPQLIFEALRLVTKGHRAVVDISCGGEFNSEELSRTRCTEAAEPLVPLFVFDEVDRLSDEQLIEICEAVPQKGGENAAAVLLARPGFLSRLEQPQLQRVKNALAARFRSDEIGEDESIDFLRHQLQTRRRNDEERGIRPVIFRASAAFAAVVAVGVGAVLTMHYIETGRPTSVAPSPPAATAMSAAVEPPPTINAAPRAPPQPVAASLAPPQPAAARVPPAEIAALVARGDDFLKAGDIASARLFYERAADAGNGAAALRLGATFDPGFLATAGVRGTPGDPARAVSWYARALDLGEAAAAQHLKGLDNAAR